MKKITQLLREKKTLVSDGAWGTMLQAKGLKTGECPELWNITHRVEVLSIAKAYINAGSDMIGTNSFGGNKFRLEHYGLTEKQFELNKAAAEISKEAAGNRIVLGSIGPSGKMLLMGDITEEELYETYKVQAIALQEGGADAACIETFSAIDEAVIAIKAVKENSELEIISTFTFEKTVDNEFKTMMGVSVASFVEAVIEAGAGIIGTNCGNGFDTMVGIVKEMRIVNSDIPIIVQANAGLPTIKENKLYYPESPGFVAGVVPKLVEAGVNIIGGCCGTTPEHIEEIKTVVERLQS
ncbi:MAG TPA: homocysteine S-methyltransferase family protein [Ignavibacteriaceae bacterium]|nr:homocysteine S-methyltransferase family protein [Ignavibacteriaceae bacterium]